MTAPKRAKTKTTWTKGMPSPNPEGRPRTRESWSEIAKIVGDMCADDVIQIVGTSNDLGQAYSKYPKNVQIKFLILLRVVSALMHDPTSGLLKELLDRIEGKVPDRLQMDHTLDVDGLRTMIDNVYGKRREN